MDEIKVRLAKVSKQLEDMQAAQQTLAAQQAHATGHSRPWPHAPPPDVLYNNALRDYNGGKNELALQEFSDYIKFYPNTDLAGNCYFYLGRNSVSARPTISRRRRATIRCCRIFPAGTKRRRLS